MQLTLTEEEASMVEWFLETGRARDDTEDKARWDLHTRLLELCPWWKE
jgi:hypothetical protein